MVKDKHMKSLFHLVGLAGFRRNPGKRQTKSILNLSAAQLQYTPINHAMAKGLRRLYFEKGV
jgi:hypothetical protein